VRETYRAVLVCGALPLLLGSAIFLLWVPTRWSWLMPVGVLVLVCGLGLFVVGAIALLHYCRLGLRAPELPRRFWRSAALGAVLLLSNFPAAGTIVYAASALYSRYTVVVRNESRSPLEEVRVTGGGCEALFESIPPGEEEEQSFWVQRDGSLVLHVAGMPPKTIMGYVTNSLGGHTTATVHPDGSVTAVDRD
jgi:hypothetical protein